jgi:hypothetical protein
MARLLGIKWIETFPRASKVTLLRAVPSKTIFSGGASCASCGAAGAQTAKPTAQADHTVTATYHLPGIDFRISGQLFRAGVVPAVLGPSRDEFRTPDVVEFAVSPKVGQAVRNRSGEGPSPGQKWKLQVKPVDGITGQIPGSLRLKILTQPMHLVGRLLEGKGSLRVGTIDADHHFAQLLQARVDSPHLRAQLPMFL